MRSQLIISRLGLLLFLEQLFLGELQVSLQRFEIGPGREVGEPVLFGSAHHFLSLLQCLGKVLLKFLVHVGRASRVVFFRQRLFQMITKQIDQLKARAKAKTVRPVKAVKKIKKATKGAKKR